MKKTLVKGLALAFVGSFFVAGSALAVPFNSRPVTPGDADLQNFFNSKVTGATYKAVEDQSSAAIFHSTGTGDVTAFTFSAIGGGNYGTDDVFGLYSYNTGMLVPIFDLSLVTTASYPAATVNFGDLDFDGNDDDVWVTDNSPSSQSSGVILGSYCDFGSDVFGYYTGIAPSQGSALVNHYTEDDKNGNEAWALTYNGHGGNLLMPENLNDISFDENHWMIAFETFTDEDFGDKDFDDLIVVAESIQPIPEPATMLLFGTGLAGLATLRRRKAKK